MFFRIHPEDLVIGKKYNIDYNYKGIFKGPIKVGIHDYLKFDYTYFNGTPDTSGFYFTDRHSFYQMIPQAQWKMERRAVNLIVRRLIGDDYFEW